ncbi:hypothetical protein LLH00_10125 [bacterium]|nr:hypothetical protein [bacterium]
MRTIRISEEVWNEIAKRCSFGETPDIVLRRVFSIDNPKQEKKMEIARPRFAQKRMTARIAENYMLISFKGGASKRFLLPSKNDKSAIKRATEEAMGFADSNGASHGQIEAVRKAFTSAGYWINR